MLLSLACAKEAGQVIFENSCKRCHGEGSPKPLSYLQQKYKGNPQAIIHMAKACPWGRRLSEMEIELVSKWIAGVK
ncbi:MAG: cytochrome c [Aquificota bacterium]|nr:MAG: cytochrome c [Aquificota bacterium]